MLPLQITGWSLLGGSAPSRPRGRRKSVPGPCESRESGRVWPCHGPAAEYRPAPSAWSVGRGEGPAAGLGRQEGTRSPAAFGVMLNIVLYFWCNRKPLDDSKWGVGSI